MQQKHSKLKLLQELAEKFTKEAGALSEIFIKENQILNTDYPHITNQFKLQIHEECTKTRTSANARQMNIKMKLNELQNQVEVS